MNLYIVVHLCRCRADQPGFKPIKKWLKAAGVKKLIYKPPSGEVSGVVTQEDSKQIWHHPDARWDLVAYIEVEPPHWREAQARAKSLMESLRSRC